VNDYEIDKKDMSLSVFVFLMLKITMINKPVNSWPSSIMIRITKGSIYAIDCDSGHSTD